MRERKSRLRRMKLSHTERLLLARRTLEKAEEMFRVRRVVRREQRAALRDVEREGPVTLASPKP